MPKGGSAVVANAEAEDVQYPCLVRAVYKKNKISTIVSECWFYVLLLLTSISRFHLMILIDSKTPTAQLLELIWIL